MQPQKNREKAIDKGMLALLCTLVFRISNPFYSVMFCFYFTIQLFMKFVNVDYLKVRNKRNLENKKNGHPLIAKVGSYELQFFFDMF